MSDETPDFRAVLAVEVENLQKELEDHQRYALSFERQLKEHQTRRTRVLQGELTLQPDKIEAAITQVNCDIAEVGKFTMETNVRTMSRVLTALTVFQIALTRVENLELQVKTLEIQVAMLQPPPAARG